jgi:hypothetical protein
MGQSVGHCLFNMLSFLETRYPRPSPLFATIRSLT